MDESKKIKKSLKDIKIHLPSQEELLEIEKENYEKKKEDINNFSYWYPKIKDCGLKTPESIVIPLNYEWSHWLNSDCYTQEKINKLTEYIIKNLQKEKFDYQRTLFIKNNNFSNKFSFNDCKVTDISHIGQQFLNIAYAALCVGAGDSTEVVVREYIDSIKEEKPAIYNGMPLNTEYRLFYDFDVQKIITICNYWEPDVMNQSLANSPDEDIFKSYQDELVKSYEAHKEELHEIAERGLSNVKELNGVWSVDFMYIDSQFYLIDMATAETSYYREKIQDYLLSKEQK